MSSARHTPRISGMSFGLLISELNSSNLTDSVKSFRAEGSVPDSERAVLRKVGLWVLGVPVVVGVVGAGVLLGSEGVRGRRRREEMMRKEEEAAERQGG